MARLSDAFIDDRAPATRADDAARRAAARGSVLSTRVAPTPIKKQGA